MKVELLSCTPNALELLLYTKDTRLQGEQTLQQIEEDWSDAEKEKHFKYMLDTIQSSFEFVDYIFKISGVPRSFTHQLVRTRTGSYAQESQRTVDVRGHGCEWPTDSDDLKYAIMQHYGELIDAGVPVQEAREILPIGVHTSIIAKFNLRTLHDMALVRLCTRTAGMYQNVFKEIKRLVVEQHPWAEDFLQVHCSWYGTCAFPRYEECPIQQFTVNKLVPATFAGAREDCRRMIDQTDHVANPVAKDGMSMSPQDIESCETCLHCLNEDNCDYIKIPLSHRKACSKYEDDGVPF